MTDAVQADYLANATWQMRRATWTKVRQIKVTASTAGDQQYALWTPSLAAGQPDLLNGYPVFKNDLVPAVAANAIAAIFGDIAEAYAIVDKGMMQVLPNPYKSNAFVYYYFWKRTGGGVVNFEAVKYLKIAAS
jgi:HK97 family phage major capsid protein